MNALSYIDPDSPPSLEATWLRVFVEGGIYTPHLVRIRKRWFTPDDIRKLDLKTHTHTHAIYHLIYYLEGTNSILVGDETVEVSAGQMLLIDPDISHNIIPREPQNCTFLTLMFTYQDGGTLLAIPFQQLLGHLVGHPLQVEAVVEDTQGVLRSYFTILEKEVLGCGEQDLRRVSYCLAGLLNELVGASLRREQLKSIPEDILEVQRYMQMHLDKPIMIETLQKISHLSRSQLIGKFKQYCGMTPIDFLIHERIEQAKILLSHSSKRIKEIAWLCGFQSEYYFCNTFKRRTKRTPGQFRRDKRAYGRDQHANE